MPGRCATAIDRVISAAGSCSARSSTPSRREFAAACGARDAVGVGTGTDALAIALRALGIGPGDEVITSPLSAAYSRARDHDGRGTAGVRRHRSRAADALDPEAVAAAVTPRTAAILPVHLYGQAADMPAIVASRDAPRPRDRRGLLPGAPGHLRRPAGRQLRSRGGLQLLSDQEPRCPRRRRRSDDQRRRPRGAGPAAPQRRPDRSLSSRRVRRELAARRDAGGDPPRQAAAAAPAGPRRRRQLASTYSDALAAAPSLDGSARGRRRARLSPVPGPQRRPCGAAGSARGAGIETLIHYPVPIPRQPALAAEASRRAARSPTASAPRCSRCHSIPRSQTKPSSRVADDPDVAGKPVTARIQPQASDAGSPACRRDRLPFSSRSSSSACAGGASSEAAPAFQGLFDRRPRHRLPAQAERPHPLHDVRVRHHDCASTATGCATTRSSAPRRPDERRILLLGDSLVLSVQVPFAQTFGELLEQRLNRIAVGPPVPGHQRRRAGLRPGRGAAALPFHRRTVRARSGDRHAVRRQRRGGGRDLRAASRSATRPAAAAVADTVRHPPPAAGAPQHGAAGAAAARR